jgi:hypothetical protein
MKTTILRSAILASASAAALACTSCATTGNPREGGIFWSESKAQDRLAERQATLEDTERRTQSTQRKSAETQRQIDALR